MLSFETRTRLADLFFAISEGERQVEVVRQILCEQVDFEPYAAFKRIDRSRKGTIDSYDILRFLADNKIQSTEENCRAFIKRYDVDGDGQLVYNEFLCSVLPMDNPTLRTIASQRPNYDVAENQFLSYDVEYSLSKVIDREISLYTSLDYPKASLHKCYDFNYLDAFNTINITPGKITYDRLEDFFRKLCLYPNEDEMVALLRRLDRDDDGCLTYEEFVMGLEPLHNILLKNSTVNKSYSSTRDYVSPPKPRVYTPARNLSNNEEQSQSLSQSLSHSQHRVNLDSLKRIASPRGVSSIQRGVTPLRGAISPSRNLNSSLRKAASPSRAYSPSRVISPNRSTLSIRPREANSFQDSLNRSSFLNQDRPASPVKYPPKESQSQSQFGFRSTASTLKVTERASSPLRVTLNNVGRNQSSPLRQSQLGSSIGTANRRLLKSSEKSILKKNGTYSMSSNVSEKTPTLPQTLALSTKKENKRSAKFEVSEAKTGLIEALKQFVQLEKELEGGKQDLALRPDFNLLDFFRSFDVEGRGAISSNELKEGLERCGVIASKEQLYLFVRRFDRDNDGKLKFSDFAEAFTCKQQEYATLLNNRTPINADLSLDIDQTFSEETMKTVARALRMHLDNEVSTEAIRQRLARRYKFNAHEGFSYLDLKEDGAITAEELGEILDKNDSYVTQKELGMLVDRMDMNKDGKVTYSEFVQEMTPKSEKVF